MSNARAKDITDTLRQRLVRALQAGVLKPGDRLPSTRKLARQLDADARAILAAYQRLKEEGLVELRERSGIYVRSESADRRNPPLLAQQWFVDVLVAGIAREIPVPDLPKWLQRSVDTRPVRTVAVARTTDQAEGMSRELRGDYGLDASPLTADRLAGRRGLPQAFRRADLVVTTDGVAGSIRPFAERHGKPCIVIAVRPDFLNADWQLLLRSPVYVVMTDARFAEILREYFKEMPAAENIRPVILGRDDPFAIPADAPTYITRSARERLGDAELPGILVPTARIFSQEAAREIVSFLVETNFSRIRTKLSRRGA